VEASRQGTLTGWPELSDVRRDNPTGTLSVTALRFEGLEQSLSVRWARGAPDNLECDNEK